jgi:hypothetical protein
MRRILFGLAACMLGLALTTSVAQAHGRPGVRVGVRHGYHGARHAGYRSYWGRPVYSTVYNRYQYWDTYQKSYFFYDAGCGSYVRCP